MRALKHHTNIETGEVVTVTTQAHEGIETLTQVSQKNAQIV